MIVPPIRVQLVIIVLAICAVYSLGLFRMVLVDQNNTRHLNQKLASTQLLQTEVITFHEHFLAVQAAYSMAHPSNATAPQHLENTTKILVESIGDAQFMATGGYTLKRWISDYLRTMDRAIEAEKQNNPILGARLRQQGYKLSTRINTRFKNMGFDLHEDAQGIQKIAPINLIHLGLISGVALFFGLFATAFFYRNLSKQFKQLSSDLSPLMGGEQSESVTDPVEKCLKEVQKAQHRLRSQTEQFQKSFEQLLNIHKRIEQRLNQYQSDTHPIQRLHDKLGGILKQTAGFLSAHYRTADAFVQPLQQSQRRLFEFNQKFNQIRSDQHQDLRQFIQLIESHQTELATHLHQLSLLSDIGEQFGLLSTRLTNTAAKPTPKSVQILAEENQQLSNRVQAAIKQFIEQLGHSVESAQKLVQSGQAFSAKTGEQIQELSPMIDQQTDVRSTLGNLVQLAKDNQAAVAEQLAVCEKMSQLLSAFEGAVDEDQNRHQTIQSDIKKMSKIVEHIST